MKDRVRYLLSSDGTIGKTGFFQTCCPLFGKDLEFDYMSLWQSSEFSKPHNRDVRKNIRHEGGGFKYNLMSNYVDPLQMAKVLEDSADGAGSGKVRRDRPHQSVSRGGGSIGAVNARAGAGFICAAKKAVIMFMACSAVDEDGPATVCAVGPERPRDLDMDSPASLTPSKSGMLEGWYFVDSPTDKHNM